MKYIVILGDGMADYCQKRLNDKTPLEVANIPIVDYMAKNGEVGLCRTIPDGLKPGSDVANLSVLGYDVKACYTGRSPLEAASIGINIQDTDVTLRANLVTLSNEENYVDKTMLDYSAGEISTQEARELIEFLAEKLNSEKVKLYAGISYRHCLVVENGSLAGDFTPPHDITNQPIKNHLPTSSVGKEYLELMVKSYDLLKDHPVNKKRISLGKRPANSLWFWGEGTKPRLEKFKDRYGLKGAMISAVDLLKGIGKLADMKVIEVEGATGNYDTNFSGKAKACVDALASGIDFCYIHIEAPDECGHHGDADNKIFSIEQIDQKVVKYIKEEMENRGEEYSMLICPDHPTPLCKMTHVSDPIPFIIYRSNELKGNGAKAYTEKEALGTGLYIESGEQLMKRFLEK
ncbi:MAG: cofactor-independent phosphoglycerate mutase [Clostridia bacterium]|nr:cofactor-independent phosphoglycerate mutase [Clostridia bacterium]